MQAAVVDNSPPVDGPGARHAVRQDLAAGGVVFRHNNQHAVEVLLINDRHGNWTLPKGHLDPGETNEQAALREITEETGVTGQIVAPLQSIHYQITKKGEPLAKTVAFFLVQALTEETSLPADGEVLLVAWCSPDVAFACVTHEQVREVLHEALALLPGATT